MKIYKSDKIRFIFGLIFIVIIYTAYFLFILENFEWSIPRSVSRIAIFMTTVIVYLIGTFHLGKLSDSWMSSLWHIIHVSGFCFLTLLGLFHWFVANVGSFMLSLGMSVQEMLISPMLYLAMGLMNNSLKSKSSKKTI